MNVVLMASVVNGTSIDSGGHDVLQFLVAFACHLLFCFAFGLSMKN